MSDVMPSQDRKTPLYDEHVKLGARMVSFTGWSMPIQFAGIVAEHTAVRTAAGVFDASHMGELELSGEWSGSVVNYLVTGDVTKMQDGTALYTCAVNAQGLMLDDLIIYRAAADKFLVVCNASNRDKIAGVFQKAAENHCTFVDRSDETALLALQGPKAAEVLSRLGGEAARAATELTSFHFRDCVVANVRATVARTGYTGEDGFEIFCGWNDAAQLYRTMLEVGRELGCVPAGLGARDTLRLEARLSLYGNDIDETTNPIEAGLGWIVKLDKDDFVGKAALVDVKAAPLPRKMVGFEMVGKGIARHGYPLKDAAGAEVGVCTSGGPSPTLGKNIGLGYLRTDLAEVGTKFQVDCRGRLIEAVVVKTPFYRRPKN